MKRKLFIPCAQDSRDVQWAWAAIKAKPPRLPRLASSMRWSMPTPTLVAIRPRVPLATPTSLICPACGLGRWRAPAPRILRRADGPHRRVARAAQPARHPRLDAGARNRVTVSFRTLFCPTLWRSGAPARPCPFRADVLAVGFGQIRSLLLALGSLDSLVG